MTIARSQWSRIFFREALFAISHYRSFFNDSNG